MENDRVLRAGDDAGIGDASALADVAATGCVDPMPGAPPNEPFRRVRTTEDLPDDAPGAYRIHVLYVEPSDRTATARLDEDGSIRRSVTAFNGWLEARTGGPRFRIDTCKGVIDVTYVKLPDPFTEAALAQGTTLEPKGTAFLRDRLEAQLKKTFADPKTIYLVYYDGLAFGHCGGAPFPPVLIGRFPVHYVGGIYSSSFLTQAANAGATQLTVYEPQVVGLPSGTYSATLGVESVTVVSLAATTVTLAAPLGAAHGFGEILTANERPADCRANPFSSDGISLGYSDYTGAHELLHSLGIVNSAAPFHSTTAAAGHLTELSAGSTNDLMYQGSRPWTCAGGVHANPTVSTCVLDPAHENYWMLPHASTAVDLSRSVYLDPTPPDAVPPPGG